MRAPFWRASLLLLISASASACPLYSAFSPLQWFNVLKRNVSSRAKSAPVPSLLAATGKANALFLVQKKYGYSFDPKFVEPMGKAIEEASGKIQGALAGGQPITEARVFEWMDGIARTRAAIAKSRGEDEGYGVAHPRTEAELPRDFLGNVERDVLTKDYLSINPDHVAFRHAPFYERALKRANDSADNRKRKSETRNFQAFGEEFPGSVAINFGDIIIIFHPTLEESVTTLNRGMKELALAINDKHISEAEFIDRAAQAYALLMHATPYERGTPSIVEGFIDSALRAKFGKTLGQKTEEPFWEVILRSPAQGPFRGPDFLRCFAGGS